MRIYIHIYMHTHTHAHIHKHKHTQEYLDAASGGTWTVNVGYGRTEIADAVRQQVYEALRY